MAFDDDSVRPHTNPPHHRTTMPLSFPGATFIGIVLEGIFYGNTCARHTYYTTRISQVYFIPQIGLYCIIYILYIRIDTSKQRADRNFLIYPISSLFFLCSVFFALDFSDQYFTMVSWKNNFFFFFFTNTPDPTLN